MLQSRILVNGTRLERECRMGIVMDFADIGVHRVYLCFVGIGGRGLLPKAEQKKRSAHNLTFGDR